MKKSETAVFHYFMNEENIKFRFWKEGVFTHWQIELKPGEYMNIDRNPNLSRSLGEAKERCRRLYGTLHHVTKARRKLAQIDAFQQMAAAVLERNTHRIRSMIAMKKIMRDMGEVFNLMSEDQKKEILKKMTFL